MPPIWAVQNKWDCLFAASNQATCRVSPGRTYNKTPLTPTCDCYTLLIHFRTSEVKFRVRVKATRIVVHVVHVIRFI